MGFSRKKDLCMNISFDVHVDIRYDPGAFSMHCSLKAFTLRRPSGGFHWVTASGVCELPKLRPDQAVDGEQRTNMSDRLHGCTVRCNNNLKLNNSSSSFPHCLDRKWLVVCRIMINDYTSRWRAQLHCSASTNAMIHFCRKPLIPAWNSRNGINALGCRCKITAAAPLCKKKT